MQTSAMTIRLVILLATVIVCPHALSAVPQSGSARGWHLPRGGAVKDEGPRTYRLTMIYDNADAKGDTLLRQRLTGEYTRGLPDGKVEWNAVTQEDAVGANSAFSPAQKRDFMAQFRYKNHLAETMKPEFFATFPPMAMFERNLIWDTGMIEYLGQEFFDRLELNTPFHVAAHSVDMPGVGTFQNRDLVLEWVGRSRRNGKDCAVVNYQAFLNPLSIELEGFKMQARSEYWGQIWVATASKQIEYATLHETVIGQMQMGGQPQPQLVNVFRSGVLEPISAR